MTTTDTRPVPAGGWHDQPSGDAWAMLDVDEVVPAPDNPRRSVGDLTELKASIEAHGLLEPLLVMPHPEDPDRYLLVCGARRLAAATELGLAQVPAVVKTLTEPARVAAMLVENVQRSNLTPLEEAAAFARLLEVDDGATQRDLAVLTGVSQATISKRLALLELPVEALEALDSGGITLGQAQELHKLVDAGAPDRAAELARQKVAGELPANGWRSLDQLIEEDLDRARAARRGEQTRAELEAQGVTILEEPKGGWANRAPRPLEPAELEDQELGEDEDLDEAFDHQRCIWGYPKVTVAVDEHAKLKCHAAAVCEHGEVVWMCRDPKQHAGQDEHSAREAKRREAFEREQAEKRAAEKALSKAATARGAFLGELLAGDLPLGGDTERLEFLLRDVTAVAIERLESEAAKLACKLLQLDPVEVKNAYATTKDWRLTLHQHADHDLSRTAWAVFLAEGEFRMRWTWGNWRGRLVERYIATIQGVGYQFGEAERAKLAAAVESEPAGDPEDLDEDLDEATDEDGGS
jgi:ParB/RepB/Spo0J family partition protein